MERLIYLDNAATSFPKPEEVYVFMDYFYRNYGVNPGRSGYDLCLQAGHLVEETRKLIAEFFSLKDPNRVIFSYNSTDALNLAIFGILEEGDHAITTTLEHNSVLRPLYHLQKYRNVEVDYVPFDHNGFVDPDEFKKRFKKNTKLVVVNHGSNVIGTVQPVKEIGKLCREREVAFLIDSSQTAGKVKIDMEEMNIDLVAFTGHKSLMGPTGIGGLCVREGINIKHTRAGGTGVRSAERHHLEEYPYRLEYGTPNLLGIAGLNAGVEWLLNKGIENIQKYEMELTKKLISGLKEIERIKLYCQDSLENHISVFIFNVEGLEAGDTGTFLDVDYNIACRTGLHCAPLVHEQLGTDKIRGAVRFSVGPFNKIEDIDSAINALKEIVTLRKKR